MSQLTLEIVHNDLFREADVEYTFIEAERENNMPAGVELVSVSINGLSVLEDLPEEENVIISRKCLENHIYLCDTQKFLFNV